MIETAMAARRSTQPRDPIRWRAGKIHAELSKLGIRLSLATISRSLPKITPDPGRQQR